MLCIQGLSYPSETNERVCPSPSPAVLMEKIMTLCRKFGVMRNRSILCNISSLSYSFVHQQTFIECLLISGIVSATWIKR